MIRILIPLFFSIIIAFESVAQKKDITLKEYFADAEYFFVAEEYIDALQDYLEVYKRGYEDNANINYKIGVCYLNIPGQKGKAVEYLTKSLSGASSKYTGTTLNELYAPLDAYLYLGNAYRVMYQLDKAIEQYNKYLEELPSQAIEEKGYAEKQIEAAHIAEEFVNTPKDIAYTNLGGVINTSGANHNCVVSGDGSVMVFMTKLPFYEAVFMSRKRGGDWAKPINITPQIMSDGDQYVTGISFDGKTLLLAKQDIFDSDIFISYFENNTWTKSKPFKAINSRFWESHASFNKAGNKVYFTSNRRGGFGGMDIYETTKLENGDWSEPVNMGENINTELNEDTPFITDDGNKLYFSSQGHTNMGGYDFFVSHLSDEGWGGAENLNYPLCTTDEDLFYYPYRNGEQAYTQKLFTDGKGSWDIYLVEFPEAKEEQPIAEKIEEQEPTEEQASVEEQEKIEEQKPVPVEEKTEPKTTIQIRPVLFTFDKYNVSTEAKTTIAGYIKVLKENPQVKIKIIGYTDALGAETYNLNLSRRRAMAVKNYFVGQGVASNRIEAIGLGEKQFIAINKSADGKDSPEGRRYNRRTEFEFLNAEDILVIQFVDIVPENLKSKK